MTSVQQQAAAWRECVGVHPLGDRAVIRVLGEERREWVNGQVTNDIRALAPGQSLYALVVTVKGKILADVWVLDTGRELALLVPASMLDEVMQRLEKYILMEDVELAADPEARAVALAGPSAGELLSRLPEAQACAHRAETFGEGGHLLLADQGSLDGLLARLTREAEALGGARVDGEAFELARLRAGRPRFAQDFDPSRYPQEVGLKHAAVSFHKGCYTGQEVIVMLEHRGKVKSRLMTLELLEGEPPAAGATLTDSEGQVAGTVTSSMVDPEDGKALLLGQVQRAAADAGATLNTGSARVRPTAPVGEPSEST